MRASFCLGVVLLIGALGVPGDPKEEGFVPMFDGKSLEGWQPANEPGHGSGCIWSVRDGVIDGVQQSPGAWGVLHTAKSYGDFELRLEVKTEWPFDAGVIVRSTFEGHGYEVLIHSRDDGDVGGVAGSRIGDFHTAAKNWKRSWKKDDWNQIRIEVKGHAPEIRTWLNGTLTAEMRCEAKDERVGPAGRVSLKIHADEGSFSEHVLFRNVRILESKT